MKLMLKLLGAVFALSLTFPDDAEAARRGYRGKNANTAHAYTRIYHRRPASVASNGLCQRDTGTPTSSLNFRNRCDTEEFWNRMQERGNGRR